MTFIYILLWTMAVVAAGAAGIGIATGHETVGAIVSVCSAVIALVCGTYILKKGD